MTEPFYQFDLAIRVKGPCLENIERHIKALKAQAEVLGVNPWAPLDFYEVPGLEDQSGKTWCIEVSVIEEAENFTND